MACDSTHTTSHSAGAKPIRDRTALIRSRWCGWPSPKLNPISELHPNSASRTVRRSSSGTFLSSTENIPRPWLCSDRQAIVCCMVISATVAG